MKWLIIYANYLMLSFKKGIFQLNGRKVLLSLYIKRDINQAENYRGITLLSTLGKLFSSILNNRLTEWAEEYHIYLEAKTRFQKKLGYHLQYFCITWCYQSSFK